jgi:hypothetical protein
MYFSCEDEDDQKSKLDLLNSNIWVCLEDWKAFGSIAINPPQQDSQNWPRLPISHRDD